MKRIYFILSLFVLAALACNFGTRAPVATDEAQSPATVAPPVTEEALPAEPATAEPEPLPGLVRACANVNLTIPEGLAVEIDCQLFPPASGDEIAPWEVTPGHTEIALTGYTLSDKFHRPRLYIFPVVDLIALQPYVAENINSLQVIQAAPETTLTRQDLPGIHLFNAGAVFASNISRLDFENGSGVRALTVYGQYFAPINNQDLFYHFQGLTENGQYYIIAILPVTHPGLQADSMESSTPGDPAFPLYPGFSATTSETDIETYYMTMGGLLDAASPGAFSPSLAVLDALIASIEVGP
jgi:hypothetical protein